MKKMEPVLKPGVLAGCRERKGGWEVFIWLALQGPPCSRRVPDKGTFSNLLARGSDLKVVKPEMSSRRGSGS